MGDIRELREKVNRLRTERAEQKTGRWQMKPVLFIVPLMIVIILAAYIVL